jgi:hypothetical protein
MNANANTTDGEVIDLHTSVDAAGFVAQVRVPRLTPRAEIILWGERFFVRAEGDYERPRYREAFVWFVPAEPADTAPTAPAIDPSEVTP